ncbi:hypothetical protein PoB_004096700 [Plakobranchus ocellatus]|uniref:Uncharacterized protein n=1 Tax=Plakobranchus ocellatus TaxID=259542 RepID=A0AAV4B5U1_9GAST|nr:hypothetical protein PoB_004096700 [Plakobranchus ocellatus]
MSDKNLWRRKVKETDPEKYSAYLEKQRQLNKKAKDLKKKKWMEEPHTHAMILDHERQLVLARSSRSSRKPIEEPTPRKAVKDMSAETYKEHRHEVVARCRSKMSSQKKAAIRKKDRIYRENKKRSEVQVPLTAPPVPTEPQTLQGPDPLNPLYLPDPFLNGSSNSLPAPLFENSEPLGCDDLSHGPLPDPCQDLFPDFDHNSLGDPCPDPLPDRSHNHLPNPSPNHHPEPGPGPSSHPCPSLLVFYTRDDISGILPHKRYSTKHGPAFFMNMTMLGAYKLFKEENPDFKVGYTKFTILWPRNVRKLGQVDLETCLSLYCQNVRHWELIEKEGKTKLEIIHKAGTVRAKEVLQMLAFTHAIFRKTTLALSMVKVRQMEKLWQVCSVPEENCGPREEF